MAAVDPIAPAPPPTAPDVAGFRRLLRLRDFRLLWLAQVAAQLGDKFFAFSLLLSIYALTHAYISDAALLLAYTIPSVFLSVPAGIIADQWDKQAVMLWSNLARGALVLGVPALELTGIAQHQAAPLYAITLVFAGVGQLFAPAEAASIPVLVPREQLVPATSLFTITLILTIVVAVPAASIAQTFFGLEGPYYFGAALFLGSGVAIWAIRTKLSRQRDAAWAGEEVSLRQRLRQVAGEVGVAYQLVRGSRILRFAFSVLTVALVVVFTIFALSAGYMQQVLRQSPRDSAILLLPATVGMIAMGVAVTRRAAHVGRARTIVLGLGATGVAMLVLGVLPPILGHLRVDGALVPLAVGLALLFGLGLGAVMIPALVLIQEHTEEATRGTIFGGAFVAINLAIALPLLVAGAVADIFGANVVIAAAGVLLLGTAGVGRLRRWGRLDAAAVEPR